MPNKKYASSGDSEKRKSKKCKINTLLITSLSCTRVRLPPEVNDTMAGAKWANNLVAPQDNALSTNTHYTLHSQFARTLPMLTASVRLLTVSFIDYHTHTHARTHARRHARARARASYVERVKRAHVLKAIFVTIAPKNAAF